MPLSPQHVDMLRTISRHYPALNEIVDLWRKAELETMAAGSDHTFGTMKGRVQLLTELQQHLRLPQHP